MARGRGGFRGGPGGEQGRGGFGKTRGHFRGRGRRMSHHGFKRDDVGRGGHGGFRGTYRGGRGGRGNGDREGHVCFTPRGSRGMGGGPPKHSRFDRGYKTNSCNASGSSSTVSTESLTPAVQRSGGMWKFRLVEEMKDPEKQLFVDDRIVILNDAYPKAEKHFLVLPRKNISSLADIQIDDIELLKHMDRKGREMAVEYGEGRNFQLGYHAQPHMERLHLHVISNDMNSASLKHLRHWNLFTTPLLMDSKKVIKDLETLGEIQFLSKEDAEFFMNAPLKCHKCSHVPKDMPALKKHLLHRHSF